MSRPPPGLLSGPGRCYRQGMKAFLVDTVATVLFFTCLAAFSELVIAGMEPRRVLVARLIMIPVMILTARPYGLWRDLLLRRIAPRKALGRTLVDTAAFLGFQVPVYAATLAVAGASRAEILAACLSGTLLMLVIGRPFGLFLDGVRRMAGTTAPAQGG